MDAGSRVALTTHYTQLKELAARDDRFGVSAMQFVDGRPTYRLIKGAVGESFALQASEFPTVFSDIMFKGGLEYVFVADAICGDGILLGVRFGVE